MSQDSPDPFSPQDFNSNASGSPWGAASQPGSHFDSLTLPPIDPEDNYDPFEDAQYFDSLPRFPSPEAFSSRPAASRHPAQPTQSQSTQSTNSTQLPPSNQQARSTHRIAPLYHFESRFERYSASPDPFEDFIDVTPPRSFDTKPSRSHNPTSHNATRESSFVDLTESSPGLTMPPSRKRKAGTSVEGRATKVRLTTSTPRRRATPKISRTTPAQKHDISEAEVVDLVDLDPDTKYEDFKKAEQERMIKQQQQEEANRPVKLAEFQCIVCMDNPTDLTVTHCGMFVPVQSRRPFQPQGTTRFLAQELRIARISGDHSYP